MWQKQSSTWRITMIHFDSFSGAVADLSKKEQGVPTRVLAALTKNPRVSTWDMSESRNLRGSLRFLIDDGKIEELKEPYPWHRFQLTDKGKAELENNK